MFKNSIFRHKIIYILVIDTFCLISKAHCVYIINLFKVCGNKNVFLFIKLKCCLLPVRKQLLKLRKYNHFMKENSFILGIVLNQQKLFIWFKVWVMLSTG